MVYNALKMFMEINPELFEEAMQQFKHNRVAYASLSKYNAWCRSCQLYPVTNKSG